MVYRLKESRIPFIITRCSSLHRLKSTRSVNWKRIVATNSKTRVDLSLRTRIQSTFRDSSIRSPYDNSVRLSCSTCACDLFDMVHVSRRGVCCRRSFRNHHMLSQGICRRIFHTVRILRGGNPDSRDVHSSGIVSNSMKDDSFCIRRIV
jgi:hypothetical protein